MNGTIITKKGLQLLTKIVASGTAMNFTRAAVGTGTIPDGYPVAEIEQLEQFKMNCIIREIQYSEDTATINMQISSKHVDEDFVITEAAIFAQEDGYEEILYAYLDMSKDPQYVYKNSGQVEKVVDISFHVVVGLAEYISGDIDAGALVTTKQLETELNKRISNEEKGVPGGLAVLDQDGKLLVHQRAQQPPVKIEDFESFDPNDLLMNVGEQRTVWSSSGTNGPGGEDLAGSLIKGQNIYTLIVSDQQNTSYMRTWSYGGWGMWGRLIGEDDLINGQNYLSIAGLNMRETIHHDLVTDQYLEGNRGRALINSTAAPGAYVSLLKSNSTNGYFTLNNHNNELVLGYTKQSTVDDEVNELTQKVCLLNESGNSMFPNLITAKGFGGSGVVNNLTTTDGNKVLDARQGKVLNDKLTQLISELTWTWTDVPADWMANPVTVQKQGKMKTIKISSYLKDKVNGMKGNVECQLCTLPEEYRPTTTVITNLPCGREVSGTTSKVDSALIYIHTDGRVTMTPHQNITTHAINMYLAYF